MVPVTEDSAPRSAATRPSGRVLIAEDNPINQRVAMALLEHLGFDVDVVADGAAAVHAAALSHYRVILMDCQLPGLDGYAATAEIRRRHGPSRRTPIIAVTASAVDSDRRRCLAAGMDDFLAKPLALKALTAVLTRWAPRGSEPVSDNDLGEQPATDPGRAVLDANVVARLERLGATAGDDLIGQLATLFLADADARIGALRRALAEDDAGAVVRSAHTLSGSSANIGATNLSRLCVTLATGGAAGALVDRGSMVDGIEAELVLVRAALGSLVPA